MLLHKPHAGEAGAHSQYVAEISAVGQSAISVAALATAGHLEAAVLIADQAVGELEADSNRESGLLV